MRFTFTDTLMTAVDMAQREAVFASTASREKDRRWHAGRASGFREMAVVLDAARRCINQGGIAVELRTFDDIEKDMPKP